MVQFGLEFGRRRIPLQLQGETAECGIACLVMIANWHGHRVDLAALRSRFSVSLKGSNLAELVRCAELLHLSSRPLRLELEEISLLPVPCILHWDLNHFVVLAGRSGSRFVIHDPALGVRRLTLQELGVHFTGVALELTPMNEFRPTEDTRRVSLGTLTGKLHGVWRTISLIFAMAIGLEMFALAAPFFSQWIVDEVLTTGDRSLLNVLVCGFGLMLIIQSCLSMARGWTVMYLSTHLNVQWAGNVFSHLLHLPLAWFEKRHLGDIVSRFKSLTTIQNTLTHGFIEAILDGLLASVTLCLMFVYSAELAVVVIAAALLYALLRVVTYRPLREANEEGLALDAKEQSCFMESMRGIQAIKLFSQELDRRRRWLNTLVEATNRDIRTGKFMLWFGVANTAIFGAEHLLLFWLGAGRILDGAMTVGMLLAFSAFASQFSNRMASLVNKLFEFKMLSLHAERLADIVLEPAERCGRVEGEHSSLIPCIELIDIGFRYAEGEPWLVRHLNLTIEAGESVAIVGPSGCGKTTLAKLILGILPLAEGEIRYGGVPIRRLGITTYRQQLAAVMQDDCLLTGSLAENISFFDTQIDMDRVRECARVAAIHDDIVMMPMGYQTLVGDMGTSLSGGQKQRIALARALYRQPRVLLLDEATSHLDLEKERQVNAALSLLQISRISIAHRPETIAMATRVIDLAAESAFDPNQQVLQ
jgi:ATP-binding cassette subfamily B protein RaxB